MTASRIGISCTVHPLLSKARKGLEQVGVPSRGMRFRSASRARTLIERIVALPEAEADDLLANVFRDFSARHADFESLLWQHFELVAHHIQTTHQLSPGRCLLIGACFTREYTMASQGQHLSMVAAPSQEGLRAGQQRFVMSVHAARPRYRSSLEFRSGTLDETGLVLFDASKQELLAGQCRGASHYHRSEFGALLDELGAGSALALRVLAQIPEQFTLAELEGALLALDVRSDVEPARAATITAIRALTASHYVTTFPIESELSNRVIHSAKGCRAEDGHFVPFTDRNGTSRYYATYSARAGVHCPPLQIETKDFATFNHSTLRGSITHKANLTLFPRRIRGRYVMLCRDRRNALLVSTSESLRTWKDVTRPVLPLQSLTQAQLRCASAPLETNAGWLLLTHRTWHTGRHTIGAVLLDLDDPSKVIGQLPELALGPRSTIHDDSEFNASNCGALIHGKHLFIPYACSTAGIEIARVSLVDLLSEMDTVT